MTDIPEEVQRLRAAAERGEEIKPSCTFTRNGVDVSEEVGVFIKLLKEVNVDGDLVVMPTKNGAIISENRELYSMQYLSKAMTFHTYEEAGRYLTAYKASKDLLKNLLKEGN